MGKIKIMHLSDLHIGIKLMNYDLKEEQQYVFQQIIEYAKEERPDAVLIAGDIYDKSIPGAEAVELLDQFVTSLHEALPEGQIMMISGNHDSQQRVDCYRGLLCRQNIHMVGMPPRTPEEKIEKIVMKDSFGEVNFYLLPFVKPAMVRRVLELEEEKERLTYEQTLTALLQREEVDEKVRNVLVTHQFYLPAGKTPEDISRMDSEICTAGNIDAISADCLDLFDYVALGHIHKPMKVGKDTIRYCGTPYPYSVEEGTQQKGVILAELGAKGEKIITSVLPLNPWHRVREIKGTFAQICGQACDDYVRVVLQGKEEESSTEVSEKLHLSFPHLLEIRREQKEERKSTDSQDIEPARDPMEMCRLFLGEIDEEEESILQDVINTVKGV